MKRSKFSLPLDCALAIGFAAASGYLAGSDRAPFWILVLTAALSVAVVGLVWLQGSNHRLALQRIDLALSWAMLALESDASLEERRTAFEQIQELYEPKGPMAGVKRYLEDFCGPECPPF
jgi:hypothetical protein